MSDVTLAQAARRIAAGELSPVELAAGILDRVDELNPELNCYLTVLREQALAQAEALEQLLESGVRLGPLHGVPIALKDNMDTAGIRTTAGARVFSERVPENDATVTARLRAAGTVLLGKLQMHELAGGSGHPDFGHVRNPWNTERTCGGSSSGSGSAVAAGLALGALGSDTGGSIRFPASLTGITGLKPTHGLVPRTGVVPLSTNLDHVGPMARTAEDVALLLQAIAGHDPRDPSSVALPVPDYAAALEQGAEGLVVGVPREPPGAEPVAREVAAACAAAVEALAGAGATLVEVDTPDPSEAILPVITIIAVELADFLRAEMAERPGDVSEWARRMIRLGQMVPATDYVRCQRERTRLREGYARVMERVDLIATAVVPVTAWGVATPATLSVDGEERPFLTAVARYSTPYNLTGQPAISIPCGFGSDGMPIGLQLAGRLLEDATVLRAAHAYQQVTDWHERRPPVGARA